MQGQRTDHIIGAMDARSGLRSGCQAVATDTAQSIQPTHTRSEVCEDEFRCSRVLKKRGAKVDPELPSQSYVTFCLWSGEAYNAQNADGAVGCSCPAPSSRSRQRQHTESSIYTQRQDAVYHLHGTSPEYCA
uniref:Uncharacterized protein n=1 Tax=Eutreptiella gymnastica TaxID=73025 RepID=A0A7S1IFU1_9EUGL|mmetsp:Transcript_153578/g.268559  ORF Transcript_153578/g.268559 Transcript_153578/m.268559 type:complete len:132 (+) Transcript_153578:1417-1812(+)